MSEPAGGSPRDIPSQRGNEREAEDPVGDDELAAPDSGGTGTPRSASSDAAAENDQVDVVGDVSDYEIKLDVGTLRDMGLADLPETRHSNIFRMLYDELEMRVGTALAEQMSDVQLEEFEAFIDANDETGGLRWLQQNFPAYRETVRNEFAKLSAEVRGIANAILHITAEMMPADEATDPTADQSTVADLVTDAGTRAIDGMFGNPSKAGAIADDTSDDGGDAQPETHGGAQ